MPRRHCNVPGYASQMEFCKTWRRWFYKRSLELGTSRRPPGLSERISKICLISFYQWRAKGSALKKRDIRLPNRLLKWREKLCWSGRSKVLSLQTADLFLLRELLIF